jgi:hypothetical protein
MGGKAALVPLIIIFLLAGLVYSQPALKVVVLANSIDYSLAQDFIDFLKNRGLEVHHSTAEEFPQYKNERFIIILGGHRAYEGVGAIVSQVLLPEEKGYLGLQGNRKLFVKTNIWRKGQVVLVLAGHNRALTKQAHRENKAQAVNSLREVPEKIFTSLAVYNVSIKEGQSALIKARLMSESGGYLVGKTVDFYRGQWEKLGSAVTDEEGFAMISYAPNRWGPYDVQVSFPGDASYAQSMAAGLLKVMPSRIPTSLRLLKPIYAGESGGEVRVTAVLEDILDLVMSRGVTKTFNSTPVPGKTISFEADGILFEAVTDEDGHATVNFTMPSDWISGYREIKISFSGDTEYLPSQGNGRLAVSSSTARRIRINEVELNPAGDDRIVGEWIEFYNPTSSDIDLVGWKLNLAHFGISLKGLKPPSYLPLFGTVPPGGYLVRTFYKGALGDENKFVLVDAAGIEVDKTPFLIDAEDDDRAWGRSPNGMDTDSDSDWQFQDSTWGKANR